MAPATSSSPTPRTPKARRTTRQRLVGFGAVDLGHEADAPLRQPAPGPHDASRPGSRGSPSTLTPARPATASAAAQVSGQVFCGVAGACPRRGRRRDREARARRSFGLPLPAGSRPSVATCSGKRDSVTHAAFGVDGVGLAGLPEPRRVQDLRPSARRGCGSAKTAIAAPDASRSGTITKAIGTFAKRCFSVGGRNTGLSVEHPRRGVGHGHHDALADPLVDDAGQDQAARVEDEEAGVVLPRDHGREDVAQMRPGPGPS